MCMCACLCSNTQSPGFIFSRWLVRILTGQANTMRALRHKHKESQTKVKSIEITCVFASTFSGDCPSCCMRRRRHRRACSRNCDDNVFSTITCSRARHGVTQSARRVAFDPMICARPLLAFAFDGTHAHTFGIGCQRRNAVLCATKINAFLDGRMSYTDFCEPGLVEYWSVERYYVGDYVGIRRRRVLVAQLATLRSQ